MQVGEIVKRHTPLPSGARITRTPRPIQTAYLELRTVLGRIPAEVHIRVENADIEHVSIGFGGGWCCYEHPVPNFTLNNGEIVIVPHTDFAVQLANRMANTKQTGFEIKVCVRDDEQLESKLHVDIFVLERVQRVFEHSSEGEMLDYGVVRSYSRAGILAIRPIEPFF